jgi:phosphoglycerol transferase MdoB-like AlkP superfamily enzyme
LQQPFLATVFTLSSHHPYKIPDKYVSDFPNGTLPIHQSIRYADYSLKMFFESASKLKWFNNTLFVITADHTAESEYSFYRNHIGLFSIPIIYYCQSDSLLKGKNNMTTQQIDILPSIMDYLGYRYPFYALGKSALNNSGNNFAVSYIDDTYQLIEGEYALFMDTLRKNSIYKFTVDSALTNNLAGTDTAREKKMEIKLKAIIQQFNHSVIHNEMKLFP